jgi:two-component system OmpR family sensor kinase
MTMRGRLMACLLAISALGMAALAIVTYVNQRDFLYTRLDDQVRDAPHLVASTLDYEESLSYAEPAPVPSPTMGLPQGSYGQVRTLSGQILVTVSYSYGQHSPPLDLPSDLPVGRIVSVDGWRLLMQPLSGGPQSHPQSSGQAYVLAALPLGETNETLSRLLLIEALVIAGVLAAIAALSLLAVRVSLRPLRLFAQTAESIAAGDVSQRLEQPSERGEIADLATSFNTMLDSLEGALGEKAASEGRLRQFVSDASHELRTPLTSIRGWTELYRLGALGDPERLEEAMGRIEGEGARMSGLVEQLLALARLDEAPQVSFEAVEAQGLVAPLVADAQAASGRDVALEGGEPVWAWADPGALSQVVGNLLANACQHGQGRVRVRAWQEGHCVLISVRDEGPGLPEPTELVFDRFWRASASRERPGGNGLGLAIARGLVEAQGGALTARNEDGGAVLTISLRPLSRDGAPGASAPGAGTLGP